MKKMLLLGLILTSGLLLSGCTQAMVSSTGYDLSALEICIDDMVDADSNTACDASDRDSLLEEYVQSFEEEFDATNSVYTDTQLSYSINKTGDIERIEFWFQYALLSADQAQTNLEMFKGIIQTMSEELNEMNDIPEYIFSGEFMFLGNLIYKFHHDSSNEISEEILEVHVLEDFTTSFELIDDFLLTQADDDELKLQTYTITSYEYSVKIYIHPADNTWSYDFYFENPVAVLTILEAETLVENLFTTTSLTLITE